MQAPELTWLDTRLPAGEGALGLSLRMEEGRLLASWVEPAEEGHVVRFASHVEGTWSAPSSVVESEDLVANWADFPRVARGGDGALHLFAMRSAGEAGHAYATHRWRSTDDGATWSSLGRLHTDASASEHGFVSFAPSDAGLEVFWLDGRATQTGGATQLFTRTASETLSEEASVDARVCDCCQTDAARTEEGAVVAYRGRSAEEIRDVWLRTPDGSTRRVHADEWHMPGCPVNGPAIVARGRRVVVAWFTGATGGSVLLAESQDGGRSFTRPRVIDDAQPAGRVDLAWAGDGVLVSWLARRRGPEGEVRLRALGEELGPTVSVAPIPTSRDAGFPVLATDETHAFVGVRDPEAGQVRVLRAPLASLPRDGDSPVASSAASAAAVVGAALPAGAAVELDEERPLASLASERPLVAAFFARWCQPCRAELRALEALRRRRPDLRVLAIGLDAGGVARATRVARDFGFEGEVAISRGVDAVLAVPPLPAVVVVGTDGVVRQLGRGADANSILARIDALLPAARAPQPTPNDPTETR